MRTAMGCFVLSGKHAFSEEQEDMRAECSSGINGDRVAAAPDGMSQTWSDKVELDDSRCVEVTQRAVLPAEEESQREAASDTL